jgi:transposase InsO family protein
VRPLVAKAFKQGFFWPSALKDAEQIVRTCEACQMMGPKSNRPSQPSQLIPPAWPLQRWGMDLVGPLPTAQGNYKYVVVVVGYFTKWTEAKPLIHITLKAVIKFFWQNIICRFGVPKELIVDNGKQFDSELYKEFYHSIGTKIMFASIYHPQSNEAVERANGLIFSSIKKCLFDQKKGKWVDELPKVIWSHNTSKSRTTRFTPFRLLHGAEAMSPEELKNKSLWAQSQENETHPSNEADLIELDILQTANNLSTYQQEIKKMEGQKGS